MIPFCIATRAMMHVGLANPWWQAKPSRHFRHMCNPQFYVSGKRPMEVMPINVTSGNHGLLAHVTYWFICALLELCTQSQVHSGSHWITVAHHGDLDTDELGILERDIPRTDALLYEHHARTREISAHLLFHQLSMDSGQLRHLEASCWQDYIRASILRFSNNHQAHDIT